MSNAFVLGNSARAIEMDEVRSCPFDWIINQPHPDSQIGYEKRCDSGNNKNPADTWWLHHYSRFACATSVMLVFLWNRSSEQPSSAPSTDLASTQPRCYLERPHANHLQKVHLLKEHLCAQLPR